MKWRPEEAGKIVSLVGGGFCGRANNDEEAVGLCIIHNVDIDALTAERDELQRRLDAVVASLKPGECKDWLGGYWLQKHTLWTRAVAIAEGRNNG